MLTSRSGIRRSSRNSKPLNQKKEDSSSNSNSSSRNDNDNSESEDEKIIDNNKKKKSYQSKLDFSASKPKPRQSESDSQNNVTKETMKRQFSESLPVRKSSRATKFSRSLKEQDGDLDFFFILQQNNQKKKSKKKTEKESQSDSESGFEAETEADSESDLPLSQTSSESGNGSNTRRKKSNKRIRKNEDIVSSTPVKSRSTNKRKTKSPAVSHSTRRRKVKSDFSVHSEEVDSESNEHTSSSQSESEEEEEEELKIQRIIASRSETRKVWRTIVKNMNTSEVENGSRWFQDDDDVSQDHVYEERFLVKWADVGYLHCSWELEEDLLSQVENAKAYLRTFFRKSINGLLFSLDERGDGEYYNPDYLVIERIIAIDYPTYDCVYTKSSSKSKKDLQNEEIKKIEKNDKDDKITIGDNENKSIYGIVFDKKHPEYEERTGRQFLIKWTNLCYSDCTYEFERDLILHDVEYVDYAKLFLKRRKKPTKSQMLSSFNMAETQSRRLYKFFGENANITAEEKEQKVKEYQEKLQNITFPNGGQLRDYQAEGVSWILSNYINSQSSILADEMGLGKTLQTAVYINVLATTFNKRGPYLIVAPLSTVQHWLREFTTWTGLNTIIYHGSAADREYIREYEFAFECDRPEQIGIRQTYLSKIHHPKNAKWTKTWMVEVVITTPEIIVKEDFTELCAVPWEVMVVDEAHKLKNFNSKLATCLRSNRFQFNKTLLLTGTPIQNNIGELWTLMNFIDPDKFNSSSSFLQRYGVMKSKERIDELHENIRPYILRRLKEDVEKSVPPKEETIIEVELTVVQKQYYRALYEKNVQFLHKNKKKALDGPSINNLAMQLRKCCNHPFLLRGVEQDLRQKEDKNGSFVSEADFLCKTSGKLILLDKLLPRLKSDGHRVLMFSQFKIMLDVLEDYLRLRNMNFERIDGSIMGQKRQMAIDRFQAKKQEGKDLPFIMLLSTRAGGVGINLTAADTCIIYDSDWNPQNDLQAQARCHRIGQTKNVKIYRLLTSKSYEMQMFHMSSLKMGLDQAVLQGIENYGASSGETAMTKEEVERLLRHGAYDMFQEEKAGSSEKESNEFEDADIDTILARRSKTVIHENTGSKSNAAGGTFSKAVFKSNKVGTTESNDVDIDDPEFWKKMVGESYNNNEHDNLIEKKRKRKVTNYSEVKEVDDGSSQEDSVFSYVSDSESDYDGERYRWGGKTVSEWAKTDVDRLIDLLTIHGYNKQEVIYFELRKHAPSCSRYSKAELLKMCWTITFIAILEAVDLDVSENAKRAERAAKRKNEAEAKTNSDRIPEPDKIYPEKAFWKVIDMHAGWLSKVFQDASACKSRPRKQSVIDYLLKKKHNLQLFVAFNDNVWPALKSRGWKVEEEASDVEPVSNDKKRYSFKGRTYNSINQVLNASKDLHPELKHVIASIQQSQSVTTEGEKATTPAETEPLSFGNLSYQTLQSHLEKFGCLQLIFDRSRAEPYITYPRKFLNAVSFVQVANQLISSAEKLSSGVTGGKSSVRAANVELQKLLQVSSNAPLPHPQWKRWHDAILVRAIRKHGWIECGNHFKSILQDINITWGHPFEDAEIEYETNSNPTNEEDFHSIEPIASRAAEFLNKFCSGNDEIKGLNKKQIISTYYLRKEQIDSESNEDQVKWIIDRSQEKDNIDPISEENDVTKFEEAAFPTRQDLLKRAKFILTNASGVKCNGFLVSNMQKDSESGFKHAILNQSKRSNFFLAELLRVLIKIPGRYAGNVKFSREIFDLALNEAEYLFKALSCKKTPKDSELSERKDLENIVKNLRLIKHNDYISRPVKNVFRAILGLEINSPISSNTFPILSQASLGTTNKIPTSSVPATQPTIDTGGHPHHVMQLRDTAIGEDAISKALELYLQKNSKTGILEFKNEEERRSHLRLTSFEVLLLNVVCSQGLPVWNADWKELFSTLPSIIAPNGLERGREFKISWLGMGHVVERAAKEWRSIALMELSRVKERLKHATCSKSYKACIDKLEVMKHDAKTKDEAYKQAIMVAKDPFLLGKRVIMLLEALRIRMGTLDVYRGANQKQIRKSANSDNGLGPRVLNWLCKEIELWAQSLNIIDESTKRPLSFPLSGEGNSNEHDPRTVALLDKNMCRHIYGQVAQQSRLRSVFVTNGLPGVMSYIPNVIRTLHNTNDEWKCRPFWWYAMPSNSMEHQFINDINLLCGVLNFGYSGFEMLVRHYPVFRHYANQPTRLSRNTTQPRINQLTRELNVLEESANIRRILEERKKKNSFGTKRLSGSMQANNPIQTGLGAFFTSSRQTDSNGHVKSVDLIGEQGEDLNPSPKKRANLGEGTEKNVGLKQQIDSNVINLCDISD